MTTMTRKMITSADQLVNSVAYLQGKDGFNAANGD